MGLFALLDRGRVCLVATEIRRKPEFSQRVCRDTHTHLVQMVATGLPAR